MSGTFCSVLNCYSNCLDKSLLFFRLPKNTDRCNVWLKSMGRPDLIGRSPQYLYVHKKICSLHFEEKMFVGKKLIRDAEPTVYYGNSGHKGMKKNPPPQPVVKIKPQITITKAVLSNGQYFDNSKEKSCTIYPFIDTSEAGNGETSKAEPMESNGDGFDPLLFCKISYDEQNDKKSEPCGEEKEQVVTTNRTPVVPRSEIEVFYCKVCKKFATQGKNEYIQHLEEHFEEHITCNICTKSGSFEEEKEQKGNKKNANNGKTTIHLPGMCIKNEKCCVYCMKQQVYKKVMTFCPNCADAPFLCIPDCFRKYHSYE